MYWVKVRIAWTGYCATSKYNYFVTNKQLTCLRFCGRSRPKETMYSVTNEMLVTFRSNYSENWPERRRGFKASFEAGRSSFTT